MRPRNSYCSDAVLSACLRLVAAAGVDGTTSAAVAVDVGLSWPHVRVALRQLRQRGDLVVIGKTYLLARHEAEKRAQMLASRKAAKVARNAAQRALLRARVSPLAVRSRCDEPVHRVIPAHLSQPLRCKAPTCVWDLARIVA